MKKGIIISTILVLMLAGIAFSRGWKGSSGGWRGGYWGGWGAGLYPIVSLSLKYGEELGLDQGQISTLKEIQADFKAKAEAQSDKRRTLVEGFKADVEEGNSTAAEQKIREMGELRTSLLIERLKAFIKAKTEVLTPDQYSKLTEIIKSKRGPRGS